MRSSRQICSPSCSTSASSRRGTPPVLAGFSFLAHWEARRRAWGLCFCLVNVRLGTACQIRPHSSNDGTDPRHSHLKVASHGPCRRGRRCGWSVIKLNQCPNEDNSGNLAQETKISWDIVRLCYQKSSKDEGESDSKLIGIQCDTRSHRALLFRKPGRG